MDEALTQFIRKALARGIAKPEIEAKLLVAGWPEDEVRTALSAWADADFPIPVPRPKPYLSAREAFTYLVLFMMLYASAWSLGSLLLDFIERTLPDAAGGDYRTSESALRGIRWAVSILLVAFPGYFWLSRRSYRAARRDPEKRKSKVRKWLTYLTLFLAAATLLGDLISLVFSLLEGELTIRFLLKTLTVGSIAGSVFGYYLWDLKQDDLRPKDVAAKNVGLRLFAGIVASVVFVSLLCGLLVTGSPNRARRTSFDTARERHLVNVSYEIDRYWQQFESLPTDLEALERTRGFSPSIRDPETETLYAYRIVSGEVYELCADFTAASYPADRAPAYRLQGRSKFWEHGAGRTCFEIEVRDKSR